MPTKPFNLLRYKQAYNNETAWLRDYLRKGFDPYDYVYKLKNFLQDEYGFEDNEDEEEDEFEFAEKWIENATPEQLESFKNYIGNHQPQQDSDSPPYEQMEYKRFIKPTWLVHFTDDPEDIALDGFRYGHEEFRGLGLTTWKRNRKQYPGYNFAFTIGRNATNCAMDHKYGKHAVVFWGSGIEAFHYGDEEYQVIIWGPSVQKDMIFPIYSYDGEWVYEDSGTGRTYKKGDFNDVVSWVEQNYRMIQSIRGDDKRKRAYNLQSVIKRASK